MNIKKIFLLLFLFFASYALHGQNDYFQLLKSESDALFSKGEYAEAYQRYVAISWAYDKPEQSRELRKKIQMCRDSINELKSRLESKIQANEHLQREYENQCLELAILKSKIAWLDKNKNEKPEEFKPNEHITKIDLSGFGLTKLPKDLTKLSELRKIELRGNVFVNKKQVMDVLSHLQYVNPEYLDLQFSKARNSGYQSKLDSLSELLTDLTKQHESIPKTYYEKDSALSLFKRGKYIDALLFYDLIIDFDAQCKTSLIPFQTLVFEAMKLNIDALKEQKSQSDEIQKNTHIVLFDRGVNLVNPYVMESCQYFKPSDFKQIKELSFVDFDLKTLPPQVEQCVNLEYINLIGNERIDWRQIFEILPVKTKIYISISCYYSIPTKYRERVAGFRQLYANETSSTNFSKDRIEYIEVGDITRNNVLSKDSLDNILEHENLKHLVLKKCKLTELPAEINNLKNLTKLELIGNKLTTLPNEIIDLSNLEELNLTGNQFTTFPEQLNDMPKLKKLTLDNNSLTKLPENIQNLENLEVFNISDNRLEELVKEIKSLKSLKVLDLQGNVLRSLPDEFANLKGITVLILQSNEFTTIPEQVFQLPNIEKLDLSGNKIIAIPHDVKNLKKLKVLKIQGKKDPEKEKRNGSEEYFNVSDQIKILTQLKYLDLRSNYFRYANQSAIWEIENLETLILKSNGIEDIPLDKVKNMNKLEVLDLRYNETEIHQDTIRTFRTKYEIVILQ